MGSIPGFAQSETILEAPETAEVGSWFGIAVRISEQAAVVSASNEDKEGAAYIYERVNGNWQFVQRVQPADIDGTDDFGGKMAIDGTRMVINSRFAGSDVGAAYIFDRVGDQWEEVAKLTASDAETGDNFGQSSSVYGDRVIVGARREDTGGNDAGAAYVFERINGSWTQTAKLQSNDIQAGDRFGNAVAVWEDRLAIGGGGAVYMFELENGNWVQSAKIPKPGSERLFGQDVDLEGDRFVTAGTNQAFIYEFNGSTWVQMATLTATSDEVAETFGRRVSLSGDRVVVGSQNAGPTDTGAAFVFELQNGSWNQIAELRASDREPIDRLGSAVGIEGDFVIAGAPGATYTATTQSSAYIYELGGGSSGAPTASFTYSENDLTIDFDGQPSSDDGTIVSWDWEFGDGATGNGETTSHTYADPGSYSVTLTVTDNDGNTDASSQTIEIGNQAPVASFTASQVTGTLDVQLDGSDSSDDGSIVSWEWDMGDGATGSGETITHTYGSTGTYSVQLTVTDNEGATHSVSQDVTVSETSSEGTLHVAAITNSIVRTGNSGNAVSTVLVVDENSNPCRWSHCFRHF